MKGQTIVEVVVALAAGIVVLSALTLMMLSSLNNASEGSSRTIAIQYAQDGLETLRNFKDNNWSRLVVLSNNSTNSYCMASTCTYVTTTVGSKCGPVVSTCGLNIDNSFSRKVDLKPDDPKCIPQNPIAGKNYIRAIMTVSYGDGKCTSSSNPYCHNVQVESCFTNYDTRPRP